MKGVVKGMERGRFDGGKEESRNGGFVRKMKKKKRWGLIRERGDLNGSVGTEWG